MELWKKWRASFSIFYISFSLPASQSIPNIGAFRLFSPIFFCWVFFFDGLFLDDEQIDQSKPENSSSRQFIRNINIAAARRR